MAMDQRERDKKRRDKDAKAGVEDLRLKALSGEKKMILELMGWVDDSEQASMIMTCIRIMHSLGREGAREAVDRLNARHKIELSDSWGARFENESRRELMRDPGDEIVSPSDVTAPC